MKVAAVGGTFDIIHRGHRAILEAALSYDYTIIGLSTDEYAARRGKTPMHGYHIRRSQLINSVEGWGHDTGYEICPLNDRFGPAVLRRGVDVLVVSEETKDAGHKLNRMRTERGLDTVEVMVIPMICNSDGSRISTTCIRNGIMNADDNPHKGRMAGK